MLIVISPAKTLDFENPPTIREYTLPSLLKYSEKLIEDCRQLTPEQIASLMKVSDKIAGLNYVRFSEWNPDFTLDNAKQALFAFRGDVYTGLDADSLSTKDFNQAQNHLRILSGLYGLLRPLDLMMPYRLEMGTGLKTTHGKNLYEFWGNVITDEVNKALVESGSDILVNLASNEYFKSVKTNLIKGRIITPVFKDFKNGKYKVISFFAKKARGMMSRYIIQNTISSVSGLKSFNLAGYYFCESQSNDTELVFLRDEQ